MSPTIFSCAICAAWPFVPAITNALSKLEAEYEDFQLSDLQEVDEIVDFICDKY